MRKQIPTIILISLLILLDQTSKYFFYNQNLLQNFKIIEPILNKWISRSIPIPGILTITITTIIVSFLIIAYWKKQIKKFPTIFLVAWAIWNLIDRLFFWGVRDFINIFERFPTFNIADILINIWVIILILNLVFDKWQKSSWKK